MAKKKVVKKKAGKPAKKPVKKSVKRPAPKKKTAAVKKPVLKKVKAKSAVVPVVKAIRAKNAADFLGEVEDYYQHLGVIAFKLEGKLALGDIIHIYGHTTDFIQKVDSIQIDHAPVEIALKGDSVGIKAIDKARIGDKIAKV
jgi:hypothetical protein